MRPVVRLGSFYRALVAPRLGIRPVSARTLDVGAGDGFLLDHLRFPNAVALDLAPAPSPGRASVRGDGTRAPFQAHSFDLVFAMDVLEHVPDDQALVRELFRVVKPGGSIWLSVPSRSLTLFPPFLTPLAHRRWGHLRPGYRREDLLALLPPGAHVTVYPWNEPAYRAGYALVRAVAVVLPGVSRWLVRLAASIDSRHRDGDRGHYFCCIRIP